MLAADPADRPDDGRGPGRAGQARRRPRRRHHDGAAGPHRPGVRRAGPEPDRRVPGRRHGGGDAGAPPAPTRRRPARSPAPTLAGRRTRPSPVGPPARRVAAAARSRRRTDRPPRRRGRRDGAAGGPVAAGRAGRGRARRAGRVLGRRAGRARPTPDRRRRHLGVVATHEPRKRRADRTPRSRRRRDDAAEETAAASHPPDGRAAAAGDPAEAVTAFFALVPDDLPAAYELTSPAFQREFPLDAVLRLLGRLLDVRISNVQTESDTTALVDITYVERAARARPNGTGSRSSAARTAGCCWTAT